jgi:hypothetical protein
MGWYTSVIPALGRLRQENLEFEGSLGYIHTQTLSQKITANKQPLIGCFFMHKASAITVSHQL